jgi:hypothetical protein
LRRITPALGACNLIESLVGVPPINIVKTEITLEEVLKKLNSLEKSLPTLLDNASQVNESIESIGKRITILEASTIHDNPALQQHMDLYLKAHIGVASDFTNGYISVAFFGVANI